MKDQKSSIEKLEDEVVKDVKHDWNILKRFEKRNEDHILFAAFIIVLTSLVVIVTIYVINHYGNNSVKTVTINSTKPDRVLTSLQRALTDNYDVYVNDVGEDSAKDPAFPLDPNQTTLKLTITITNKTTVIQKLIPVSQIYIRDRDGGYYQIHASTKISNPLPFSDIKAGESITGQLSFAVPKRLSNPLLYFDPGWNDALPVVFDVLK